MSDTQKKDITQIYIELCIAAQKHYDWAADINCYILDKKEYNNDFKNWKPFQILEVNFDNLIIARPSDIDFYDITFNKTFFSKLIDTKNELEKGPVEESKIKDVLKEIKSITHNEFKDDYVMLIDIDNVFYELKRNNYLNSQTFFEMYQFFQYIVNNHPVFTDYFNSIHSFFALLTIFFMSKVGYEWNMEKVDFEKSLGENKNTDQILV